MKWLARIAIALVVLVALVFAGGAVLPREHTAAVRVEVAAPPHAVFDAIADVAGGDDWRAGLERVEVLGAEPLRWRETSDWGTLTFVRDVVDYPERLVYRIEDTGEGFGGTWTYEIAPAGGGTSVTITEEGWVSNPAYRLLSRFIFGHYTTLETYARDLSMHFGREAAPVRVR